MEWQEAYNQAENEARWGAPPAAPTPAASAPTPAATQYGVFNGSASDTLAAITRQQWADYVSTFIPIENQLIKYATDPAVVSNAMSEASQNVNQAFDAQAGATQRNLKGLGVTLSEDEKAAQTRSMGLARSLADVGSQNVARDLTTQRQQSILGNPAPQGV